MGIGNAWFRQQGTGFGLGKAFSAASALESVVFAWSVGMGIGWNWDATNVSYTHLSYDEAGLFLCILRERL